MRSSVTCLLRCAPQSYTWIRFATLHDATLIRYPGYVGGGAGSRTARGEIYKTTLALGRREDFSEELPLPGYVGGGAGSRKPCWRLDEYEMDAYDYE